MFVWLRLKFIPKFTVAMYLRNINPMDDSDN
jgi:hypothetical protein